MAAAPNPNKALEVALGVMGLAGFSILIFRLGQGSVPATSCPQDLQARTVELLACQNRCPTPPAIPAYLTPGVIPADHTAPFRHA